MADSAALSAAFESQRPHLLRIADGTLGSVADAEDVVQEAWLRLSRLPDPGQIEDLRAWLTRVVGRLALDALRRARRTREQYVCEWLPEPVVHDGVGTADLADRVTLDESATTAPLVVLESLSPAERTAFVLHDVFGMPFEEMGQVVGRTPAAVRQLAARARHHVDAQRPRNPATREHHRRVVERSRSLARRATWRRCWPRWTRKSSGAATAADTRRPADREPSVDAQPRQAHPRRSAMTLVRTRLAVPGRPRARPCSRRASRSPPATSGHGARLSYLTGSGDGTIRM